MPVSARRPWGRLVELALTAKPLGLAPAIQHDAEMRRTDEIIATLLDCLPVPCRVEFSFTTGLKFSTRRSFRWIAVEPDKPHQRQIARQHNVTVVDLGDDDSLDVMLGGSGPRHGWAAFVSECCRREAWNVLEQELACDDNSLTLNSLSKHGNHLCRELAVTPRLPSDNTQAGFTKTHPDKDRHPPTDQQDHESEFAETLSHIAKPIGPARQLNPDAPEVIEKLEALDDAVYDAIAGDELSLQRLRKLWPAVLDHLGYDLVEQSREKYLRYALAVWNDFINRDAGGPERAAVALDVMCLISDGQ